MMMKSRQGRIHCSSNYFMALTGLCKKYDFETLPNKNKLTPGESKSGRKFLCNNGQSIDNSLLNDLFSDCKPDSKDEPILL